MAVRSALKFTRCCSFLKRLKWFCDRSDLRSRAHCYVLPVLDWCLESWNSSVPLMPMWESSAVVPRPFLCPQPTDPCSLSCACVNPIFGSRGYSWVVASTAHPFLCLPWYLTAGGLNMVLVAVHLVCGLLFGHFYLLKFYQGVHKFSKL